ncbi:MAG: WG repeat-containing protein [Clostridia bacterium]|nr:WG repeat-containing protein [Tissierellia bacterium]MDD4376422.1 WG repeat-containing protein [Clostridia bacterium]
MKKIKKILTMMLMLCIINSQFTPSTYASTLDVKWLEEDCDIVEDFDNGLAQVYESYGRSYKSVGFINTSGEKIINISGNKDYSWFTDDIIKLSSYYHVLANKNTGDIIKLPKYSYITELKEGLARIVTDSKPYGGETKCGFIDENGEIVIPIIYDSVRDFRNGHALVKKDEAWHKIDKTGKIVATYPYNFYNMGDFHNGLARVSMDEHGYINEEGDIIIPLIYEHAEDFVGVMLQLELDSTKVLILMILEKV